MSTQLKLMKRDLDRHSFRGLANHGVFLLRCSACGAPLVEIMLVDPELPVKAKYRADCPHCGDHSFPTQEIQGQVYVGHTDYTVFDTHRDPVGSEPDDIFYLKTTKVKPYHE